jgi:hypothetical protein
MDKETSCRMRRGDYEIDSRGGDSGEWRYNKKCSGYLMWTRNLSLCECEVYFVCVCV